MECSFVYVKGKRQMPSMIYTASPTVWQLFQLKLRPRSDHYIHICRPSVRLKLKQLKQICKWKWCLLYELLWDLPSGSMVTHCHDFSILFARLRKVGWTYVQMNRQHVPHMNIVTRRVDQNGRSSGKDT